MKAFGINKDINERKKQGEYDVESLGYNYRMTDFQAAMGYNQLKKYNENLKRRKEIAKNYIKLLKKNKKIFLPSFSKNDSYFVFQILLETKNYKSLLMKEFKRLGIGFSVHYGTPLPSMSYYKKKYKINKNKYINSVNYGLKNISLPIHPNLKLMQIKQICQIIKHNI